MELKLGHKGRFAVIISIFIITDLIIFLNIPFLRQILGFLFLTILPGFLILQILKLNKIESTEKLVLSVGLSISFLMFFGLLLNNSSLSLGYETPLATIPLLISFNAALIILVIVGYKTAKYPFFSLPNFNLTTSEKAFLIVPVMFPALSIFGMHVMNMADNNIILMFLLFLIPTYVIFVCFFNQKFSTRMYPIVIFLISISLLLLMALRSNHIIGVDTHSEYYYFQTTLSNLHWRVFGGSPLNACLSISLLPTIYKSILNISPEFLFRILYVLVYSISPLVIYVISKKYIGDSYAFLASIFFMSQTIFLLTECNARTSMAILFFALAMMTLFNEKIEPLKKRILFIAFMASCMVSHYSTTYIFFFIMLGSFLGMEILSKKYTFKKVVSLTLVILFFAFIFFWYSQVTETTFSAGVDFIENTFINLNRFFIEESRGAPTQSLLGKDIIQKSIPHKMEFVFTWLTFVLIGIGVITLIRRYKEMAFPDMKFEKQDFLKNKFDVGYFVIALTCSGVCAMTIVLPFVSTSYGIYRLYALSITILSVFFVIGGITLSKHFFFFTKRKPVLKEKQKSLIKIFSLKKKALPKKQKQGDLHNPVRKSIGRENSSYVLTYLIILLVLIPHFFCVTGVMYNIFGVPQGIILNSEGKQYDSWYIHDQEVIGAKWLCEYSRDNSRIYADAPAFACLWLGYGKLIGVRSFLQNKTIDDGYIYGYIYIRYVNVVEGTVYPSIGYVSPKNITEYSHQFVERSKIYANGGSEVWK